MTHLRLAFRMIVKQPGMAALAVLALALGIGLTTIMFSIVNGAVLRGLPFEESDRIYHLARLNVAANQGDGDEAATLHDYADWRERQRSFEDLAAFYQGAANVVGPDGTPERYRAAWITANLLRTLRVQPVMGRDFRDGEEKPGAAPAVIISDKLWRERFKAQPDVIGQPLRVNGTAHTVVGVMAPRFAFPMIQDVWVPVTVDFDPAKRAQSRRLSVIGRLKADVSKDQADAEFATIAGQLQQDHPETNKGITVVIKSYIEEFLGTETINSLFSMLLAVFGVLVIACANVANLVLARAATRVREIAVRTAIGASRWQVARQMLAEVLVLSAIGALIGVALASVGLTMFNRAIVDTNPPFWIDIRIDRDVLAFVTLIAVVAALVSGLVPAWRASRADLARTMNDEGRTTGLRLGRFSKALVIAEMALSFGLLVVSGLVIKTIVNVNNVNFGFPMHDVLSGRVVLPETDYPDDERQRQFADAVLAKVQALPGVVSAALATDVAPDAPRYAIKFPGTAYAQERDHPFSRGATVSPDYFKVLRTGAVQGRVFQLQDQPNAPLVALVNQSFARKFFPQGAIGQQFALARGANQQWRTIVGVVPDLGFGMTNQDEVPEGFYLPMSQLPPSSFAIIMHAAGPPNDLVAPLREAVRSIDGNIPVANPITLLQAKEQGTWAFRVFGSLFMAFGFAALFLATVGLYGVMAFSVSRRTQEIGVRMAMGAAARDVLGLVLRQGLWQVGLGIGLGLGLGWGLGTLMRALLFQVRPYDPAMFIGIAAVLTLTALIACFIPAWRASRVDPMVALRYQ